MGNLYREKVDRKALKFKLLKKGMPYWIAGLIIGILNIVFLFVSGKAFGISSGFLYWSVEVLEKIGIPAREWEYLKQYGNVMPVDIHRYTVVIIFILLGALVATLLASEFKIKKVKGLKQGLLALSGGLLMGFGSRLGFGCNIGALLSGISSLSLHGWLFAILMFVGAILGSKLLLKLL